MSCLDVSKIGVVVQGHTNCLTHTLTHSLGDGSVALRAMVLWDSHPGDVWDILLSCERHAGSIFFLRNYFFNVNPLCCMIAELLCPISLRDTTRYTDTT